MIRFFLFRKLFFLRKQRISKKENRKTKQNSKVVSTPKFGRRKNLLGTVWRNPQEVFMAMDDYWRTLRLWLQQISKALQDNRNPPYSFLDKQGSSRPILMVLKFLLISCQEGLLDIEGFQKALWLQKATGQIWPLPKSYRRSPERSLRINYIHEAPSLQNTSRKFLVYRKLLKERVLIVKDLQKGPECRMATQGPQKVFWFYVIFSGLSGFRGPIEGLLTT